jgi:hypothetical protein
MAGNWSVIDPEATTNYVLNPAARTTGNFAAEGAAVVSRPVTYQWVGPYAYRVVSAGDNEGIQFTLSALGNEIHYVTMRVLGTLPSAWDWSLDNANWTTPTALVVYGNGWTLYGAQFSAAQSNASTTLHVHQNGAGGGDFYVDGVQVEALSYWTTYADGEQEGCEWNGEEDASSSDRSALSRAGGRVREIEATYSFYIDRMIDVGANSVGLSIDSYSLLPGGEFDSLKQEVREFVLGGTITGTSLSNLHANRQSLLSVLSPSLVPNNQPIRLRYDGASVVKQIDAYYSDGLNAQINADVARINALERVTVRFVAASPFFYDPGQSSAYLDTNDSATVIGIAGRLKSTGQWDPLGPPNAAGSYAEIYALAEDRTYLYVGGDFTNFDNIANADYIVRYEKETGTYTALGAAGNGLVRGLAVAADGNLYATGNFTSIGGVAANRVAYWDGTAWNAMGAGLDNRGNVLAIGLDGTVYIGGIFTDVQGGGGGTYNRIIAWDGSAYSALSTGFNNSCFGLAIGIDGNLFASGIFTTAGGNTVNYVAEWDGTTWSDLDSGLSGGGTISANELTVGSDGRLYLTGNDISTASGVTVNNIAVWNGTSWSALGDGLESGANPGTCLSFGQDGMLYVSGQFDEAGGISLADCVTKWNGASWAHLDINLPSSPPGTIRQILASQYADPVVNDIYDLFVGFNTTVSGGTAYYAGTVTATNGGTEDSYPLIVLTRSGGTSATVYQIRNETLGIELLFDYALLNGETLTIDLTPTNKSIVSSMFGLRMDAILPNSDFGAWRLQPGDNQVTCFIDVAGTPTLTSYMIWNDQYNSAD